MVLKLARTIQKRTPSSALSPPLPPGRQAGRKEGTGMIQLHLVEVYLLHSLNLRIIGYFVLEHCL